MSQEQLIKICGLKDSIAAQKAIDSGANLLGIILVPNRARTVDPEEAKVISMLCKQTRIKLNRKYIDSKDLLKAAYDAEVEKPSEWFKFTSQLIMDNGPFLTGVFRNQPLEEVVRISKDLNLDFVQLHGSENFVEFIEALEVPVIPRYVLNKPNIKDALLTHKHLIPLLDSEFGGEGKLISWDDASQFGTELDGKYILAGGLNPENVSKALKVEGCIGVDVSGGVETEGVKDHNKIKLFLNNARARS